MNIFNPRHSILCYRFSVLIMIDATIGDTMADKFNENLFRDNKH